MNPVNPSHHIFLSYILILCLFFQEVSSLQALQLEILRNSYLTIHATSPTHLILLILIILFVEE
jgi:hypothetical protein